MRKILLPLVVLAAFSLVLSACEATALPYAATVANKVIARSSLNAMLAATKSDVGFGCELTNNASPIEGVGSGTYATSLADELLTLLIERQTLTLEVDRLGLSATPTARSLARSQVVAALTPQVSSTSGAACTESGTETVNDLPAKVRDELVGLWTNEDLIGASLSGVALTPGALSAYAKAHPDLIDSTCVSLIIVSSKAKADTLRSDLLAGADFATVAKKNSTDSESARAGGAIGCVEPEELNGSLASAAESLSIGDISKTLSFEGSFLLLKVTARRPPSTSASASAVINEQADKLSSLISKLSASTTISVDPAYGTWLHTTDGYAVSAPSVPPSQVILNPSAAIPGGLSSGS